MKKRALLVGINYPGTNHALRGCVNDVVLMHNVLTQKFGFTKRSDKRMLTDHSATADNIKSRLEWLVAGAEPGDVLYFHYSGHGSQMIDTRYDDDYEPDGKDEILCPIDLNWRDKVVKDDDLRDIFDRVPEGVNLTVVLDCCHSGTGIDGLSDGGSAMRVTTSRTAPAEDSPNRSRMLPMPDDIAARGFDIPVKTRQVGSRAQGLLISGCRSDQTSADAWIHTKYMGAATYYLNHNLAKKGYDMTYGDLVVAMNHDLSRLGYTQRPELNGQKDLFGHKFLQPLV